MKRLVIIGGGITGLAAAFYANKTMKEQNLPLEVVLVEAGPRLGGKIRTHYQNGFVIEQGPDSFLARKKSAAKLVEDVGLEEQLVRNRTGQAYVLNDERLYEIPKGTSMGIPVSLEAFSSDLFSRSAKLRSVFDLVLPRSERGADQSVGNFFKRRLGTETVEKLIEPLLSGIYAGNLDQLSLMATFPQFYKMEQSNRSLMLGMRNSRGKQKQNESEKQQGQFLTIVNGLQSLVNAIEAKLPNGSVRKNMVVNEVEKCESGFKISLNNGDTITADAVISTVQHEMATAFLPDAPFLKPMGAAKPTTVATIAMAFSKDQVDLGHDGTGFVVSRTAGYKITACTWTHKKWPHTVPDGKVLLRCYVGKPGDEAIVDEPDDDLIDIVLNDLRKVTKIDGDPEFVRISRWHEAMPQYVVGHLQWLDNLKKQAAFEFPGLFFGGSSYGGVGLPDCIDQGKKAAQDSLQFIQRGH